MFHLEFYIVCAGCDVVFSLQKGLNTVLAIGRGLEDPNFNSSVTELLSAMLRFVVRGRFTIWHF